MIASRSTKSSSDRRSSSNSESSIETRHRAMNEAQQKRKQSSDHIESEEAFESDGRHDNDVEREERAGDADVDDDEDIAMNNSSSESKKHAPVVRRENLRQLESMSLRKKLRFSNERPNNNNNNTKNNNHAKGSQRIESTESSDANGQAQYICPICNAVSPTQHEFTEHIRGHNNTDGNHNYTCQICFKVVSSASSLDRHVLVHTGERPFTCRYCHLTFTTNGNMHRHMRTHKHRDGLAAKNANATNQNSNSSNATSTGNGEPYESDGSSDSSGGSGSNNNYRVSEGKRKISAVDDDFNATNSLKRRLKTINNNNNIVNNNQPAQRFCCPVCVRNDFPNMISLENHVDKEHPSVQAKCRHCEVVFKSYKMLNAHKCSAGHKAQPITQGFKDLTFVDFTSEKFPLIARSMCEQSIRTPITNQKYECPKCYRAFPCVSAVDIHVQCCGQSDDRDEAMRNRLSSETSDEEARRDDFFAHLDLKNKNSSLNNSLAESLPTSTGIDSDGGDIEEHSVKQERHSPALQHNDSKDLADIQSIINVTSSGGGFLRQLEKPIAMMTTAMENSVRDLQFARDDDEAQDAFTIEFRKMKLRGEFPCKLCPRIFPNLRALKGHNRTHYASGPGPYLCNMCPFTSDDKARLVQHMRRHNGDTPYECAICSYKFTTKANCERHLRNRHGKSTREEVKRSIIYHPNEDSSCDDPLKKMQMYNASFDDDDTYGKDYASEHSSPMSLTKEIQSPEKIAKIQVKSIEQLIQQQQQQQQQHQKQIEKNEHETKPDTKPIDLSMDALDLSKKSNGDDDKNDISPLAKLDLSQQMLLAQQQLLTEALPKVDPTHYFQLAQLYRQLVFPGTGFPLHPLFLQNPLLAAAQLPTTDLKDLQPNTDVMSTPQHNMFSGGMMMNPIFPTPPNMPQANLPLRNLMQDAAMKQRDLSPQRNASPLPTQSIQLPLTPQTPRSSHTSSQMLQNQLKHSSTPTSHQSQSSPMSPGPVKMVIKNGVLMPKQKQRRYRTERPFACEHCSARFTLRSNMERHIKQQHPQYWAQRQRSGHNLLRRSGNVPSSPQSSSAANASTNGSLIDNHNLFNSIPDQVKYAILAKQLKCRSNEKINSNLFEALTQTQHQSQSFNKPPTPHGEDEEEDNESNLVIDEDTSEPEDLTSQKSTTPELKRTVDDINLAAKKVAENILEEAMKTTNKSTVSISPVGEVTAQSTPKSKDGDSKSFKDTTDSGFGASPSIKEEGDLVSVSKLVDNATTNSMSLSSYFRSEAQPNEHSDEEGLVASGSASESNHSGTEDVNSNIGSIVKKKSAYSLAPNRVSCPYCQRMFPWSSSLRRHILTHTGQKPFKCSHCPLLFTTKSNCDRHLLRKHGDVESAMSLYVPIDDVPDPLPQPKEKSPEPEAPQTETTSSNLLSAMQFNIPQVKNDLPSNLASSDLPFKCHLCDGSFPDRITCLEHHKNFHPQDFALLLAKGAIEPDADPQTVSAEDEEKQQDGARGKYPDYANRKVICAFCVRRFWSTEDLRRHMRTHSGERPFQCDICMRKFTLKHSMLRHQKKHAHNANANQQNSANSASDMSDDETMPSTVGSEAANLLLGESALSTAAALKLLKIPDLIPKDLSAWKAQIEHKENIANALLRGNNNNADSQRDGEETSELIGNLLGISDSNILNRVLLSSADEAAKLLGVEK